MAPRKTSGRKTTKRKYSRAAGKSVASAVRRTKRGTLRRGKAGRGGRVSSRKQAVAIGLAEARAKGAKVPRPKRGRKRAAKGTATTRATKRGKKGTTKRATKGATKRATKRTAKRGTKRTATRATTRATKRAGGRRGRRKRAS